MGRPRHVRCAAGSDRIADFPDRPLRANSSHSRIDKQSASKGSRNLLAIVFRHILISETLTPFQPFFGQ
jgi:hypothetical protein